MVVNSKIKQKGGGVKCRSPVLLHGKITMRRAERPTNIMCTEGQGKNLREELQTTWLFLQLYHLSQLTVCRNYDRLL
jgi:hypothetical protein